MPKLLRFILKHVFFGIIIGWSFVAALLYFDVGGFGSLVLGSSSKWVALGLLGVSFAVTFGSASVATAVLMGHEFGDDGDNTTDGRFVGLSDSELRPLWVKSR
jgi:hypothetical protein